ncbi:MAG: fibro-slime domain-containing protein [Phycisphaerales bacterium]|nr:fibro-slime domain-containing protein [Planctomycetota bacterium]MCH8509591.1 fibro-slime domain-containing protein [Phycisphaerales bacterium]
MRHTTESKQLLSATGALAVLMTCGLPAVAQNAPDSVTLTGIVRDFKDRNAEGGHPDFQRQPTAGFGHYVGMVGDTLDADGKPVFASTGYKLSGNWRNAQNQNIAPPRPYIATRQGDQNGSVSSSEGGALTTAANFRQWFRDVPGVNASKPISITLNRTADGTYVFDDKLDPLYGPMGGFFPINGELYGNYASTGKNYHFTYELQTEFIYRADQGMTFTFIGDDDVWVFIDGKLVIDIGGVHSAISQTIELDRLEWLEDGRTYTLNFFFAERHTTQSNFRIETTLELRTVQLPPTAALYD